MESIVSNHAASVQRRGVEAVSELWDRYLVQFAGDPKLRPERLAELIGVIPAGDRKTHNHLYEAINTYLVVRQVSNARSIMPTTATCLNFFANKEVGANSVMV